MWDKNQLMRDGSTNLTGAETGNSFNFGAPDRPDFPIIYEVWVPQALGTNPTLTVKIQVAEDNNGSPGPWRDFGTFEAITAKGSYNIEVASPLPWRRYTAAVTGTNPNFGGVIIGPRAGKIQFRS